MKITIQKEEARRVQACAEEMFARAKVNHKSDPDLDNVRANYLGKLAEVGVRLWLGEGIDGALTGGRDTFDILWRGYRVEVKSGKQAGYHLRLRTIDSGPPPVFNADLYVCVDPVDNFAVDIRGWTTMEHFQADGENIPWQPPKLQWSLDQAVLRPLEEMKALPHIGGHVHHATVNNQEISRFEVRLKSTGEVWPCAINHTREGIQINNVTFTKERWPAFAALPLEQRIATIRSAHVLDGEPLQEMPEGPQINAEDLIR